MKKIQLIDDNVTKIMGVGRTKYVERAGLALHRQIVNKNPWQNLLGGCRRDDCYVCKSTGGKASNVDKNLYATKLHESYVKQTKSELSTLEKPLTAFKNGPYSM